MFGPIVYKIALFIPLQHTKRHECGYEDLWVAVVVASNCDVVRLLITKVTCRMILRCVRQKVYPRESRGVSET